MRILAIADVHCPRYLPAFVESLEEHSPPDLFLMAGDMINRGEIHEFPKILDSIESSLGTDFPIVACFGNEEYTEIRGGLVDLVGSRLTFLDEVSTTLNLDGVSIGIVGTQGSLDKPTSWQRRNIPNIKRLFERRASRAAELLQDLDGTVDKRILLMHYSPCLETCEGEGNRSFSWLGSRKFYTVVATEKPDLVIHGHVHNSIVHEANIGPTLIRNVSIPAVGRVTELDLWN
ncbi:MAG: metallophosphoesterase [Candidatus Thorarchaeota archaeon]